jgi:hypothetical protein
MRIFLRLNHLTLRDASRHWQNEASLLEGVLQCLRTSGLWWDLQYFSTYGKSKFKRLSTPDEFAREVVAEKRRGTCLLVPSIPTEEERPPYQLHIEPRAALLVLRFIAEEAAVKQQPRLLDQLVGFVSQLHARFHPEALLGPELFLDCESDVPWLRPKRSHTFMRCPLFFMSKEFQRSHRLGNPEALEKLLQAPLPPGATREIRDDLVIFRWVDDLNDPRRVSEALVAQQKWLVDVLNPPVDSSYNELGDQLTDVTSRVESSYLTFEDGFTSQGFKAMVVHPDGSVDEDTLDELATWNKAGKLPDGSELNGVSLILPNRESALRIHPLAEARGIPRVLYLDDENRLWDPVPPGTWIDYPLRKS